MRITGTTEHNKVGLSSGWSDPVLAPEGVEEAKTAGRVLKEHGIEFDIVYTSWLSRAIETAWTILDELDLLWLPILKTWRLNERMLGNLTGLSEQMVRQRYGDEQFEKWVWGLDHRPPSVSSFSVNYPGNDDRYVSYCKDVKISFFESAIRSLVERKIEIHRKFPKTESIKDCMERTIPYFRDVIVPTSVNKGKRVMISTSESTIRVLLSYLCDIPPEKIHEVNIPNGIPLLYDAEKKCIRLFDDGLGDPLNRHNFGKSPQLLFKPQNYHKLKDEYKNIDS